MLATGFKKKTVIVQERNLTVIPNQDGFDVIQSKAWFSIRKLKKTLCLNSCNYREIMTRLTLKNANVDYIRESKL